MKKENRERCFVLKAADRSSGTVRPPNQVFLSHEKRVEEERRRRRKGASGR
jgi:hypothetical protein